MQWVKITEQQLEKLHGDKKENRLYFKLIVSYPGEVYASGNAYWACVESLQEEYPKATKVVLTNDHGKDVWVFEADPTKSTKTEQKSTVSDKNKKLFAKVNAINSESGTYYPSIRVGREFDDTYVSLALEKKSLREVAKGFPNPNYKLDKLSYDGIHQLLTHKETIVALGTGLGKTIISLCAASQILNYKKKRRILVVCLKGNIKQFAGVVADEELDEFTDIVNYESFNNLIKFAKTTDGKKNRRKPILNPKSKFKYLLTNKYDVIIMDEVHKVKNLHGDTANALRHFLDMSKIEWRWGLSATPFSNSESDLLGVLASTTQHPIKALTLEDLDSLLKYEKEEGDKKGAETFKKLAIDNSIWYRRAADYGITFSTLVPNFIGFQPDEWYISEYQKIIEKARKMTITTGSKEMVVNTADIQITKLSAIYKKAWVKSKVEELNRDGKQVIVMASLNEVFLNPLAQELGLEAYTGQTALPARERIRNDFMEGLTQCILGNYGAIATGVDGLDVGCNHLIMAQPVWSIGLLTQAIGRIRRRNPRFSEAYFYLPYIEDMPGVVSTEAKMVSRLQSKLDRFDYFLEHEDSKTSNELTQAFNQGILSVRQELYNQIYNS